MKQRLFLLSTFVKFGSEPQVERLLNKWNYMDQIHETWEDGTTVLIVACIYGQTDIAALLCGSGANVNHAADGGWTALHYAAYHGQHQIAEKLLEHGALINMKTSKGHTPLQVVKGAPKQTDKSEGRAEIRKILKAQH
jgi:ankyrin repeat protein